MSNSGMTDSELFAQSGVDRLMTRQAERMTYFGDMHGAKRSSSELAEARTLVVRFLADLRDRPIGHDILDAAELPATRREMIEAFQRLIAHEPRARIRDQLKLVGLLLSQYQDGVGSRLRVQAISVAMEEPDYIQPDSSAVERMERALSAVEPDRAWLAELFDRAAEQAKSSAPQAHMAEAMRNRGHGRGNDGWMAR